MPIAWLPLEPAEMFVEGSEVPAAGAMQLLPFRSLLVRRKCFHFPIPAKEQRSQ